MNKFFQPLQKASRLFLMFYGESSCRTRTVSSRMNVSYRFNSSTAPNAQNSDAAMTSSGVTAAARSGQWSQCIRRQVDDVIVSSEDKRKYRGLELTNGLKIVLVSDPTTDKSAACLDVNIGHMNDPKDLPGLAHFCEHMLFLGTEKYPIENDYQKFLTSHGGNSNAYTDTDHTNYHFDVAPDHLADAIDRFAQFFIGPLFTESCTEREVLAVDSEHSNNVQNDSWRLHQLERSLAKSDHDYNKFGTGNKKTLMEEAKSKNLGPRQELLKFHEKFYSANLMALSVMGKESLDQLEAMVVPIFAPIVNKNVPVPEWPDHPYGPEQTGKFIHVVPVKDLRALHVFFPIPDLHPYYKSNPGHYVGHLLGHEGAGSLLSELKNRGWVNGLSAGPKTSARGFGFFQIDFALTEEGVEKIDEILHFLFDYLKMIKNQGPKEWIHREVESLSNMNFRFQDKARPQNYVMQIATGLHYYPINEVLYGPFTMNDYKPNLIIDLISKLDIKNFGYSVISNKFSGKTDQKELWYGTEYSVHPIGDNLICRISKKFDDKQSFFRLPEPNEFIPVNFDLFPLKNCDEKVDGPLLMSNDAVVRTWFKQDNEYFLPKCCIFVHFRSPVVYMDPKNNALSSLFCDLLRDSLTEYVYNAELAGLKYSLTNGRYGFTLCISGYNEKQHVLLQKLMDRFVKFEPNEKRFEILKERFVRNLRNFTKEQPYQHAMYYTNVLLVDKIWTKDEVLEAAESLTVENLTKFIPKFFDAMHVETFIHGNSNEEAAEKLVSIVRRTLETNTNFHPLYRSQLLNDRAVALPNGSNFTFEAENSTHKNSAVEVLFQSGLENPKENMLNELLAQIMHEPCYDQLRTKEQLGYIVFSGLRRSNGTQAVRFIVQGEKPADFMESRLEDFLVQMEKSIENMPMEEFEKHKTALATLRLEKPKRLSSLAGKYWSEIQLEQYHFNRDKEEVDVLKNLTKDDLLSFYKTNLLIGSPERRKLSVHVCSSKPSEKRENDAEKITNIISFKARLPLSQLPRPYREVPPAGVDVFRSNL